MKKILFYFIIAGFVLSGCRDWLDINRDPNNAEVSLVTIDIFLPANQTSIATILNNSSNQGFLAHHLTKSGSVGGTFNFLTGRIQPQDSNTFWSDLYTINTNLDIVRQKALEINSTAYEGIAITLMAHNYQRLVDMFGNVPYSEALQGTALYQPKYDDAKEIYNSLVSDLDHAIACFETGKSAEQTEISRVYRLSTVDKMGAGSMDKWIRFANSLKLRILMRMSGVQNVAAQVEAIKDKCLAPTEVMSCDPGYQKISGKMRPWNTTFGWNQNNSIISGQNYYRPTRDLIDMLRDNNDPRLRVYANPRPTNGEDPRGYANYTAFGLQNETYIGIPYGQQNPPENTHTCGIGVGTLYLQYASTLDPIAATPILGGFESSFLLAEAALKGYISGGDAQAKTHYEAGVRGVFSFYQSPLQLATASFPSVVTGVVRAPITGTAVQAADTYLSQTGNTFCNWSAMTTNDQKLEAIASQKWISLFGVNSIEAWSEQRRLDLPVLGSSTQAQVLYNISILLYPQTEINLNYDNYIIHGETRNVTSTLVFWDAANPLAPRVREYLN